MASNPLHGLIEWLDQFIPAVWRCSHASTKEAHDEALQAWLALTDPFWTTYRIPPEAYRGLADPALAWCSRKGFGSQEHVATVERAAHFVIELAKLTCPRAMPSVYANQDEAQAVWDRESEFLMAAIAAQDGLRRLAALTGEEWKGGGRLPWDNRTPSPTPARETTKAESVSTEGRIDTQPVSPTPPDALIEAAMRDVPRTMADMDSTREFYAPAPAPGQKIVLHHRLVGELGEKHRHGKAAAEWAIHRLVEQGKLTAKYGRSDLPSARAGDGTWHGGGSYEVRELKSSLIGSTPSLWEWWHMLERDKADSRIQSVPARSDPADRILARGDQAARTAQPTADSRRAFGVKKVAAR